MNKKNKIETVRWTRIILFTLLLGISFVWNYFHEKKEIREHAIIAARTQIEKDITYRQWNADSGGVYVAVTKKTSPNKYLAEVADRDIQTPAGKQLTLINPAYMMRLVYEFNAVRGGADSHITSLNPLNPVNMPDSWERQALESFERGKGEAVALTMIDGQEYLRFMQPLVTDKACLKCHAHQGYKEGDLRGGISVSLPFAPYTVDAGEYIKKLAMLHFMLWIFAMMSIFFTSRQMEKYYKDVQRSVDLLKQARNDALKKATIAKDAKQEALAVMEEVDKLNQQLEQQQLNFVTILKEIGAGIVLIDPADHTIVMVNEAVLRLTGFAEDQLLGKVCHSLICPADHGKCPITDLHQSVDNNERMLWKRDGSYVSVLKSVRSVIVDKKTLLIETFIDMSEIRRKSEKIENLNARLRQQKNDLEDTLNQQRKIKKALQESRSHLNATLQSIGLGVIVTDLESRITMMNKTACDITGWHDPLHHFIHEIFPVANEDISRVVANPMEQVLDREEEYESLIDSLLISRDGREIPVSFSSAPVFLDNGELLGAVLVFKDITVERQAERELVLARESAEAASKAKSRFLANMSHEIRTPMNGLLGLTPLLFDTNLNATQRQYAELIHSCGQTLVTIINDILDFSKIEAGQLELESLDFNLHVVVADIVSMLSQSASEKGLECTSHIAPDVPAMLVGDPSRLRQVLINLVGNAIKFTGEGRVTVSVRLLEKNEYCLLHFSVKDTGIGLTPAEQKKLFMAFSQSDSSVSRKYGGTGLGLTISRQLVELMGGEIGVKSQKGEGADFWFTLKLAEQNETGNRADFVDVGLQDVPVLVVGDDPGTSHLIKAQIKALGCRCNVALSGKRGLELLAEATADPYQIVIVDVNMPSMDGITLGQRIKDDPRYVDIKIIIITAYAHKGDSKLFLDKGFDAFLPKPIDREILCNMMKMLLSDRNGHQEKAKDHLVTRHMVNEVRRLDCKILVVDDNPTNLIVAVGILKKLGYTADSVDGGVKAVEVIGTGEYDMVLMDCQMPELDGYGATSQIREHKDEKIRKTIIIAMTAHAMKGDREKCLAAGMDDYLAKPVEPQELRTLIEKWCVKIINRPLASGEHE